VNGERIFSLLQWDKTALDYHIGKLTFITKYIRKRRENIYFKELLMFY